MAWDPLAAFEFLTVVPVRRPRALTAETLARAQAFYPLVGLALGGGLLLLDAALMPLLPAGPRSALLVAALAVATRGLHLDGLADTCDGLLGGRDAARRLEIMRDPRVGSFGAAALVLVLLLKWSAIAALDGAPRWAAVLLAPVLGRWAMVITAAAYPYARPEGLGAGFQRAARGIPLAVATGTAVVATVLLSGVVGAVALASVCLVALAIGGWARRSTGGVTGDVYGAVCELGEVVALLLFVAGGMLGWQASLLG